LGGAGRGAKQRRENTGRTVGMSGAERRHRVPAGRRDTDHGPDNADCRVRAHVRRLGTGCNEKITRAAARDQRRVTGDIINTSQKAITTRSGKHGGRKLLPSILSRPPAQVMVGVPARPERPSRTGWDRPQACGGPTSHSDRPSAAAVGWGPRPVRLTEGTGGRDPVPAAGVKGVVTSLRQGGT